MSNHQSWDVVVIGTGSGGKIAAQQLAGQGRRVVAVEQGRFGGECPYVACVPAKSLLASAHGGLSWAQAVLRRDELTDGRDDAASRSSLSDEGVETVRGRAVLDGRDADDLRVVVRTDGDEQTLTAPVVVVAPGSAPTIPPLDGLDEVDFWTSDVALSTAEQPASLLILGGGAVGCELAQSFALLGTEVTLVELADQLLPGEEPWVGEAMAAQLRADVVDVRLGCEPTSVAATDRGARLALPDGTTLEAARVLVAGGRTPRTAGLGLDTVGASLDDDGAVVVDARCRVVGTDGVALAGLFAVGDVTPESSYTHSANDQASVVAAELDGHGRDADYRAVPRVVYTEPPAYAVGLTSAQAHEQLASVSDHRFDVTDVERAAILEHSVPPPGTKTVRGALQIVVDDDEGVVVGASCVGPQADSWGAELSLAVRARVPLELLRRQIRAFPTWSEAITAALDD